MKYYLLLLTALILILLNLVQTKTTNYFNSDVKIGNISMGNFALDGGYLKIKQRLFDPVFLNINNRSISTNLPDLGYSLDEKYIKSFSKKCFNFYIKICQEEKALKFDPSKAFLFNKDKHAEFLQKLNNELIVQKQEPSVDFMENKFWILSPNATIKISNNLNEYINPKQNFGTKFTINVKTDLTDENEVQNKLLDDQIASVTKPLLIKYGRNPVYISDAKLKSFVIKEQNSNITHAKILRTKIAEYLDELAAKYKNPDVNVIRPQAEDAISTAMLYRAADTKINNAVVLPLQGQPKSNGEKADVYLEVIKSQQRLYRFEFGELTKTYIVSTGILAETPTGEFKVLGKQKKTISYVGNWWMENYLPIGTMSGNYFGFHAIPYKKDAVGNIFSRDPNTMGSPATSGCIQLTQDESLELYEWAKVGMPVYIYE